MFVNLSTVYKFCIRSVIQSALKSCTHCWTKIMLKMTIICFDLIILQSFYVGLWRLPGGTWIGSVPFARQVLENSLALFQLFQPLFELKTKALKWWKLIFFVFIKNFGMFFYLTLLNVTAKQQIKNFRSKRLAPTLIREITRRVNLKDIFQACYTAGVVIPKPVGTARYHHRSLNPKKLVDIQFSSLTKNQV